MFLKNLKMCRFRHLCAKVLFWWSIPFPGLESFIYNICIRGLNFHIQHLYTWTTLLLVPLSLVSLIWRIPTTTENVFPFLWVIPVITITHEGVTIIPSKELGRLAAEPLRELGTRTDRHDAWKAARKCVKQRGDRNGQGREHRGHSAKECPGLWQAGTQTGLSVDHCKSNVAEFLSSG